MRNFKAIKSENLSKLDKNRYVIVDTETGEVLDDAQGYGFKSARKAYACYGYKTRDKSKDAQKKQKQRKIIKWLKGHKEFVDALDTYSFEIAKGSWKNEKFNAKFVEKMLKDFGYSIDFTPGELLKEYLKF